jgi:hypothetical protein
MVLEHQPGHLIEGGLHRSQLDQDVAARAVLSQHLADRAHVSLDSRHAGQHGLAPVMVAGPFHAISPRGGSDRNRLRAFQSRPHGHTGSMHAAMHDGMHLIGVADPRRTGHAAGY